MQHQRSGRRILPSVIALLLVITLSCGWFAGRAATITNVVLAQDVQADTLDPIGVADGYSSDQPEFHAVVQLANAPAGTVVKAVWTALDVGNAAPQNTLVNQSEKQAQGTQNVHFAASPDIGRWPPGAYRLEIYVNGERNRTLNFQVAPAVTLRNTAPRVCPPLPPPTLEPSEIVASVTMALGVRAENKEPVGETTIFPHSATFHVVVLVVDAPQDTTVTATWFASDLGELSSCNTKLLTTDIIVDDTRNIDFSMASEIPWPDGEYRVEISVDGALAEVVTFEVGSPIPNGTPPTGQP